MKLNLVLFGALLGSMLLLDGCSKKPQKPEMKVEGASIDMQKVYDLARGTSPEVQAASAKMQSDLRYGQYVQALADLDKILNDPSLSPAQKKEAEDLIAQVKQLAQKTPQ